MEPRLAPEVDRRVAYAEWLTSPKNPYFARGLTNRIWSYFFHRGIIDPVDDIRSTNPPINPALLDALTEDFVAHKFDIRHTLRLIATSETYSRSGETNDANRADDRYYSHTYRRPLEPEALADAIADASGVSDRYGDNPLATRAIALFDVTTPARSLDVLGRCSRGNSCEGDAAGGGLPAKLLLLNGDVVNRKITADEGKTWTEPVRLANTLESDCGYPSSVERTDGKIVTAYYAKRVENHERYQMGVAIWDAPAK